MKGSKVTVIMDILLRVKYLHIQSCCLLMLFRKEDLFQRPFNGGIS